MTYRLYTTRITDDSLQTQTPSSQRQVSQLAGTETGAPFVTPTGNDPGDLRLRGQYRGPYAERLNAELRELLGADAIDAVALYRVGNTTPEDGYYTPERNVDGGRVQPQTAGAVAFDARLVEKGDLGAFRRAVHAGSVDARTISHDFGNATTGYVGVPATATHVTWAHNDLSTTQAASADDTVAAEFGDVDRFDIESAPAGVGTRPYLVYELDPADAGDVDAGVWDTYGDARVVNGTCAWQAVYRSGHRFVGVPHVDTGRIRTDLDTSGGLSAERWDDGTGSWTSVTLGTADWALDDVDLVRPGVAHVHVQLTFRATADTTDRSQGDLYPLDAYWHRGWADVQFAIPETESGPIPTDLVTYLDPIASDSVVNPLPNRTLIAREDLRA